MSNTPLLSVVVPIYNVALFLDTCLESVRAQGFTADELQVIMVDDGSTDGSGLIAKKWAHRHKSFHLVSQPNKGLSGARNTGIEHTTGKYLVFLDSDDIVPPHAYSNMVALLEKSGSDFVTGAIYRFKARSEAWAWQRTAKLHNKTRAKLTLTKSPEYIHDGAPWNKVYRREFFMESGVTFPEGRLYEDSATTPKLYYLASSFDVYSSPAYYWRLNPDGISLGINAAKQFDRLQSLGESERFLKDHNAPKQVLAEYEFFCIDYNLRRILLDAWKYHPNERPAIIKACCRFAADLNPEGFSRITEPLRMVIQLAHNDEQKKLLQVLATKINENHKPSPPLPHSPYLRARRLAGKVKRKLIFIASRLKYWLRNLFVYFVFRPIVCALPVGNREAVFSSYWGERSSSSSSPAVILAQLIRLDPALQYIVFAHKNRRDAIAKNIEELTHKNNTVTIVTNGTLKYYYYLWHAKWLFNDVNFQVGIKIGGAYRFVGKRTGQIEIQTTHGIPLKKMGLDSSEAVKIMPLFLKKNRRYDYLVSTSPLVAKLFQKAHDIQPRLLKTGLPQHDALFNKPSQSYISFLREKYAIAPGKRVIVYAPTWRYNKNIAMRYLIDFEQLYGEFKNSHQIIIKTHTWNHTNLQAIDFRHLTDYSQDKKQQEHPFIQLYGIIKDTFDFRQQVYSQNNADLLNRQVNDVDINELMLIADVMITDYSSTMFSYFHLGKPQIFFTPDIEFYNSTRGSYFNIDEIAPGMVAKNTDDLIKGIKLSANHQEWDKQYAKNIKAFRKDFLLWEKGGAAQKIIDEIGILKES